MTCAEEIILNAPDHRRFLRERKWRKSGQAGWYRRGWFLSENQAWALEQLMDAEGAEIPWRPSLDNAEQAALLKSIRELLRSGKS